MINIHQYLKRVIIVIYVLLKTHQYTSEGMISAKCDGDIEKHDYVAD